MTAHLIAYAVITDDNYDSLIQKCNSSSQILSQWCNYNKLSLNISKTKYINFSPFQSSLNPSLLLNNTEIEQVTSYKYLGLPIDEKLKYNIHIN